MTHSAQTATPVNKEAIRILVQDFGYQLASERTGIKQCTLRQWAKRGNWLRPKAGQLTRIPHKQALSHTVTSPSVAHSDIIHERREKSLAHLAKYAEEAGQRLSDSGGDIKHAGAFQKIASGRASLFPEDQPRTQVNVSVLSFAAVKQTVEPEGQGSGG